MLMAEEKRRCHDVFGPTLAPSVLSSLLVETFDPLNSSYQNRLSHQLTFPEVVNLCGDTTQVGLLLSTLRQQHQSVYSLCMHTE